MYAKDWYTDKGVPTVTSNKLLPALYGTQVTESDSHPWFSHKGADIGGPFYTERQTHSQEGCLNHSFSTGGSLNRRYDGPQWPGSLPSNYAGVSFPASIAASSDFTLSGLGTTAIANTIPTNPVAGLSTFIGELREGLPSLIGSSLLKKPSARNASSEYLNWQFGIKPLISDYQKFAKAYTESGKILRQLERDSGRLVRRRFPFPPEHTISIVDLGEYLPAPILDSYLYGSGRYGHTIRTTETTRERWFSGAYTYHLPSGDSAISKMMRHEAEANKLLGLRVTPEVLWDLAPWSWAADWLANTGDVLHNLGAFARDGLVLRYGYIMEHSVCKVTYTYSGRYLVNGSAVNRTMSQTFIKEVKVRRPATPYGFGLKSGDFSATQQSIIAALGINRAPKRR